MSTSKVQIVDKGRGPQIEGHRLTVMDVFYYVHRGYDFEFIHMAMPSLKREEYEAAMEYINEHYDELAVKDAAVEEWIRQGIEQQKAKGLDFEIDESIPFEQRMAKLKEKFLATKNTTTKVADVDLIAH